MSRVRSFFLREAAECLADIGAELGTDGTDLAVVYAAVRRFRGSAQMARFGTIATTAMELERRLRPYVSERGEASEAPERRAPLDPEAEESIQREIREVVSSLHADVEAVRDGRLEEDPRMEAGMEEQEEQYGRYDSEEAEVVPIETLEYQGEAALARALELRTALEDAIVSNEPAGPVLDELFDLIRLGAK